MILRERIIWLLLIATAITLLLQRVVPRPKENEVTVKLFWMQKTFADPVYDMVLIGDSRTYRGLDPATISKELNGIKVLNFGYSSAGLTPDFIDHGVAKLSLNGRKIILFCITPYSLTNVASKNEHFKQEIQRKREEILEAKYFYTLKTYFSPVNPQFVLRYMKGLERTDDSSYYHQEYFENGWVASWKLKQEYEHTITSYTQQFKGNVPSKEMIKQLVDKMEELKNKGYDVYATRIPVCKELYDLEQKVAEKQMSELKQNLMENGIKWLEISPLTNQSYDGSHLSKSEALKISKRLVKLISDSY